MWLKWTNPCVWTQENSRNRRWSRTLPAFYIFRSVSTRWRMSRKMFLNGFQEKGDHIQKREDSTWYEREQLKELKVEERHKHYPEPVSTVSNTIKVEGANTGEKMLAVIVGDGLILSWQVVSSVSLEASKWQWTMTHQECCKKNKGVRLSQHPHFHMIAPMFIWYSYDFISYSHDIHMISYRIHMIFYFYREKYKR